jgi:3-oxoacyl-[acyl-carrier protein] reductase
VIEQPVTLITGSSKGIGRFLVDHYVSRGHIVVGCSRSASTETIANYEHFSADVADERAIKAMLRSVWETYGRIDHIINNAGVASTSHFLLAATQTARHVYETNVIGNIVVCREGGRLLKRRRCGRIVNISTAAVPLRLPGEAVRTVRHHRECRRTHTGSKRSDSCHATR